MQLARNTFFNFLGAGAPLMVALFAIPPLISALGAERFGILTLIWAVVSYAGLFDLGLGRVLTRELAVSLSRPDHVSVSALIWTSLSLMATLGVLAGVFLWLAAPWLVAQLSHLSNVEESIAAARVMAVGLPFIITTLGPVGALQASGAFGMINAIRVLLGTITFLGPLAIVQWGNGDLVDVTWVLVAARIVALLAYTSLMIRSIPEARTSPRYTPSLLPRLLSLGGWITLSNIVSPLMGYIDRFVIGILISVEVVAYYAIPQEVITKLWVVPGALTAVLFPRFAAYASTGNSEGRRLFHEAVVFLFAGLLPVTLGIALFADELLTYWIGAQYASQSTRILQVFAFGILINCLAHIPYSYLQSASGAKTVALIHCAEAPLFLFLLILLTSQFGILGASFAWLTRVLADTGLMFTFARRLFLKTPSSRSNRIGLFVASGSLLPFLGIWAGDPTLRASLVALGLVPIMFWAPRIRRFFVTDH